MCCEGKIFDKFKRILKLRIPFCVYAVAKTPEHTFTAVHSSLQLRIHRKGIRNFKIRLNISNNLPTQLIHTPTQKVKSLWDNKLKNKILMRPLINKKVLIVVKRHPTKIPFYFLRTKFVLDVEKRSSNKSTQSKRSGTPKPLRQQKMSMHFCHKNHHYFPKNTAHTLFRPITQKTLSP